MSKIIGGAKTLTARISIVLMLVLVTTLSMLITYSVWVYRTERGNLVNERIAELDLAAVRLSSELSSADTILTEITASAINNRALLDGADSLTRYLALMDIASQLDGKIRASTFIDAIFAVAGDDIIIRFRQTMQWEEKFVLQDELADNDSPIFIDASFGEWRLVELATGSYLLRTYSIKTARFGVMIHLNRLLALVGDQSASYALISGGVVLAGADIYNHGGGELITRPVESLPLEFGCLIDAVWFPFAHSAITIVLLALGVLTLSVTLGSAAYLRGQIIVPIRQLTKAAHNIEGGDLDYRISRPMSAAEFERLRNSFNDMAGQIKTLKIASYEEKLNRQQVELQNLQTQLKPHFYLNVMSTISSLSMQGKYETIQRFVQALSLYMKHMFCGTEQILSTIDKEVGHVLAYVELQRLRFPEMILCVSDIDRSIKDIPIPKLMLLTFAENIFKHAFDGKRELLIFIRASRLTDQSESYAHLTIEDNGPGFAADGIGESIGIGIRNVRQTLELVYGRDDLLTLDTGANGGARVTLRLPEKTAFGID
jgi:methyl-accepting chemotaxis protein